MINKSVLIIAGSDSSAGAGMQADLKTMSAFNVYASTVFTALTAQNTKGVKKVLNVSQSFLEEQIKAITEDLRVSYIKIGMLSNENIIKSVIYCLNKYLPNVPIILDPVMVAKGGHVLLKESAIDYLKKTLLLKSFIITPNIPEAEKILGYDIKSMKKMEKCIREFNSIGVARVLLKGGHMFEKKHSITDLLLDDNTVYKFTSKRIITKNTHGTGCSLASAITANLFLGKKLKSSVEIARKFVYEGIKNSYAIGLGNNPINHFINNKVKV